MEFRFASTDKIKIVAIDERHYQMAASFLAERGEVAGAEVIYAGSRNTLLRYSWEGEEICVKCFGVPNAINSLVYTNLRQSKARRSYEYAQRLISSGVLTPAPLAYAEVKRGAHLLESFYFCQYEDAKTVRNWETLPYCDEMLHAMARFLLDLHHKGIYHRDFSPGNVLYQRNKGEDESGHSATAYRFMLVDLNRMEFGVRSRKKMMSNFKSIHLDPEQAVRFGRIYANEAEIDPDLMEKEVLDQLARYKRHKERAHRMKKLFHFS